MASSRHAEMSSIPQSKTDKKVEGAEIKADTDNHQCVPRSFTLEADHDIARLLQCLQAAWRVSPEAISAGTSFPDLYQAACDLTKVLSKKDNPRAIFANIVTMHIQSLLNLPQFAIVNANEALRIWKESKPPTQSCGPGLSVWVLTDYAPPGGLPVYSVLVAGKAFEYCPRKVTALTTAKKISLSCCGHDHLSDIDEAQGGTAPAMIHLSMSHLHASSDDDRLCVNFTLCDSERCAVHHASNFRTKIL